MPDENDLTLPEAAETTHGITRRQVDEAMLYLGIDNPKPEIPIEGTVAGHTIVALGNAVRALREEIAELRSGVNPEE